MADPVPYEHDWHVIDEENNIQCRVNADGSVDIGTPDGPQEHMTWKEFNRWRGGDDDDGESEPI